LRFCEVAEAVAARSLDNNGGEQSTPVGASFARGQYKGPQQESLKALLFERGLLS
jgi:hypothetical protein